VRIFSKHEVLLKAWSYNLHLVKQEPATNPYSQSKRGVSVEMQSGLSAQHHACHRIYSPHFYATLLYGRICKHGMAKKVSLKITLFPPCVRFLGTTRERQVPHFSIRSECDFLFAPAKPKGVTSKPRIYLYLTSCPKQRCASIFLEINSFRICLVQFSLGSAPWQSLCLCVWRAVRLLPSLPPPLPTDEASPVVPGGHGNVVVWNAHVAQDAKGTASLSVMRQGMCHVISREEKEGKLVEREWILRAAC